MSRIWEKASGYISRLEELLAETPLNIQLMNSTLQEALNFIYQLYNNVNNVVGTVVMVENTIVFGNRYRSTYADIDSELTRSELSFRNGEYTNALTTAIATIKDLNKSFIILYSLSLQKTLSNQHQRFTAYMPTVVPVKLLEPLAL